MFLRSAWRLHDAGSRLYQHARRFLQRVVGASLVTFWNDAEGRTQAEVLSKMDEAIALAEAAK